MRTACNKIVAKSAVKNNRAAKLFRGARVPMPKMPKIKLGGYIYIVVNSSFARKLKISCKYVVHKKALAALNTSELQLLGL